MPSVGDSDHSSVVQAGSHIDNLRTSPHSDESIRHSSLQPEDSTGCRALQNNTRQEPVHSFSSRTKNAADQLVDAAEGSIRLPTYGNGNEASGIQLAGGSNETHPCVSTTHCAAFPSHPSVFGDHSRRPSVFPLTPGIFHQQRDGTYTGRPETFLDPLQPISRERDTGTYPKYSFPGRSQPSDSIHYTSETGIEFRQYPRRIFTCAQSSRPSETVVGGSDGLHLLKPRESILTKTSRDSPSSGESFDDQRSVEFHSIPPISTVDGVYDKPRFPSLPVASSQVRDFKTASIIRSNRPPHPIDANVIIKSDPTSLSDI